MIPRPQANEYAAFYAGYVGRVPEGGDVIALLNGQPDELSQLLSGLSDEAAAAQPAPGEWSIKEIIGHLNDAERVFAYRALRFARGDATSLPGFNQDDFVRGTDFNARTLADLLEEFAAQRRANVLCFQPLTEAEMARKGNASDHPVSVRALLYILAGHVMHHLESLRTDYQVGV